MYKMLKLCSYAVEMDKSEFFEYHKNHHDKMSKFEA